MFVVLLISCDTRSVGLGQYCSLKVSNGFKGTDTIGNYSNLTVSINTYGNEQLGAVGSIKHCEKQLPLK